MHILSESTEFVSIKQQVILEEDDVDENGEFMDIFADQKKKTDDY